MPKSCIVAAIVVLHSTLSFIFIITYHIVGQKKDTREWRGSQTDQPQYPQQKITAKQKNEDEKSEQANAHEKGPASDGNACEQGSASDVNAHEQGSANDVNAHEQGSASDVHA